MRALSTGPDSTGDLIVRKTLDERSRDRLLRLPESGMGYQRVRLRLRDGRTIPHAVAFNAEMLELPDDTPEFAARDIVEIELQSGERDTI